MEPCSTLCCGLRSLRLWNQIKCPEQGLHFCDATSEPARDHWSLPALTLTLKVPQSSGDLGRVGVAAGPLLHLEDPRWGQGLQEWDVQGPRKHLANGTPPSPGVPALSPCSQRQAPCRSSHLISSSLEPWQALGICPQLTSPAEDKIFPTPSLSRKHLFSLSVAGWEQVQQVLSSTVRPLHSPSKSAQIRSGPLKPVVI